MRPNREAAAEATQEQRYVLRLYVAGITPRSQAAIRTVTTMTLLKKLPAPLRKVIGNMADKEKILVGLDLKPKKL